MPVFRLALKTDIEAISIDYQPIDLIVIERLGYTLEWDRIGQLDGK